MEFTENFRRSQHLQKGLRNVSLVLTKSDILKLFFQILKND